MKIYFDMDGVLAHFDAMQPSAAELNHPSADLSPEKRAAKKQFWLNVEQQPDFWRDIPVMVNIEQLLNVAKSFGEMFILSKTPSAKHFVGGKKYTDFVANEKRKWVLKHLGKFFDDKHIIICDCAKGELIHPTKDDILIDDRIENINEWQKHGGRGVLFTNAIDTVEKLKNINTPIRFCKPIGKYYFLSPLSAHPIKMSVDGKVFVFSTVEHFYQAMKFYANDKRFNVILELSDPDEARLLTKTPEYKINRRPDFDKNKFDIMERGLRAKFEQNPDAAELLKSTGDAILIKSCPVCYKCGFGEGSGMNRIGKILMQIRAEIQK